MFYIGKTASTCTCKALNASAELIYAKFVAHLESWTFFISLCLLLHLSNSMQNLSFVFVVVVFLCCKEERCSSCTLTYFPVGFLSQSEMCCGLCRLLAEGYYCGRRVVSVTCVWVGFWV